MNIFRAALVCAAIAGAALPMPALSGGETTIAIPESGDAIILPPNSSLHFRAFGPEHAVEFDGPVELSGTWYYGDNQFNDTDAVDATLYFVPDKASLSRLPRFKQRGQPGDIFLTNGADLLRAVASKTDQAKAEKKGSKYLSGKVDIWVDQFEAGIECDAPFFNARFLRMASPPLRVALSNMPDEGC